LSELEESFIKRNASVFETVKMTQRSLSRFVLKLMAIGLAATLARLTIPLATITGDSTDIAAVGTVNDTSAIAVTVDFGHPLFANQLALGVNIGHDFDFWFLRHDAALREKTQACRFRLIRLFVHEIQPCTAWNETAAAGEYSWTLFDQTLERVFEMGAEPLLVIASGSDATRYWLPAGMEGNAHGSKFPSNASFGTFCADLVQHTNVDEGWNIRFWEIWNEPRFYDYDSAAEQTVVNPQRIANFSKTFNHAADAIHAVDPTALLGHGYSAIQPFFDHFLTHSPRLGFISFHDYDAHATALYRPDHYKPTNRILADAATVGYANPGMWRTYAPQELRDCWSARGHAELPLLITETNMNSVYLNGTDPRMPTIVGAVWYAEKLRAAVFANISYSAYFTLTSGNFRDWNTTELTGGYGFGLLNDTAPYDAWFPYFTNWLLGNFLNLGDNIVDAHTTNPAAVSVMAWTTDHQHRILLISKTPQPVTLNVTIRNGGTHAVETAYQLDETTCAIHSTQRPHQNDSFITLLGYGLAFIDLSAT
jgi:hypothetical protein